MSYMSLAGTMVISLHGNNPISNIVSEFMVGNESIICQQDTLGIDWQVGKDSVAYRRFVFWKFLKNCPILLV